MGSTETHAGDGFPLTDEHRMLLRIRDTLYEGSWEDLRGTCEPGRKTAPMCSRRCLYHPR